VLSCLFVLSLNNNQMITFPIQPLRLLQPCCSQIG